MPWHILAPRAVACDSLHLRASAHLWHVSAFLCTREFFGISWYIKKPHSQWEQGENNAFNHLLLHTDIWVPFNGGITGYTYFPKAVPLSGFSFQLRSDLPFTKKHRASIVPSSLWLSACEPTVSVMAFFYDRLHLRYTDKSIINIRYLKVKGIPRELRNLSILMPSSCFLS